MSKVKIFMQVILVNEEGNWIDFFSEMKNRKKNYGKVFKIHFCNIYKLRFKITGVLSPPSPSLYNKVTRMTFIEKLPKYFINMIVN